MPLIDQIISTLSLWQKQLLDLQSPGKAESASLALLEQAAIELGKRIAQLASQDQLQRCGTGYTTTARPCPCGQRQGFLHYASRQARSLTGTVRLRRAYYRCRDCRRGAVPLDERLGLTGREISPGVERAASLLAAHLPFAETEFVLWQMTGVSLSGRQIETVAESRGQAAHRQQRVEAEPAATQSLAEVRGPRRLPPRTFINAIFYLVDNGNKWRSLPHDFPKWPSVYLDFRQGRQDGTWQRIHHTLRSQLRRQCGRHKHATAGCRDSQSVKSASRPGGAVWTRIRTSVGVNATFW